VSVTSEGGGRHDEMVRHLRLRGGALDGMTWSGVIDVGKRVCCGNGSLIQGVRLRSHQRHALGLHGQVESVAVPAAF
jgi:hypothetical protein